MARTKTSKVPRLTKVEALAEFQVQPDLASNITAVAQRWGVSRGTVRNWLGDWTAAPPGTAMATAGLPPGNPAGNSAAGKDVVIFDGQQNPAMERPAWRIELPGVTASPGWWNAAGRAAVGLAIVATAAWVAYNSMRGNAWFGHSLTPDPVAGDIYAQLSVAAEVLACLVPTGIRFYRQNGERWTALRGWVLMAVVLTVMFFAAGGFALTNINAGVEVRAERETQEVQDLRNRIATLTASIGMPGPDGVIIKGECAKRGDKCRELEVQRTEANAKLETARNDLKGSADPQAAALHLSSTNLHLIEAGAMVALCLAAGMFISFGAGLIWPATASARR